MSKQPRVAVVALCDGSDSVSFHYFFEWFNRMNISFKQYPNSIFAVYVFNDTLGTLTALTNIRKAYTDIPTPILFYYVGKHESKTEGEYACYKAIWKELIETPGDKPIEKLLLMHVDTIPWTVEDYKKAWGKGASDKWANAQANFVQRMVDGFGYKVGIVGGAHCIKEMDACEKLEKRTTTAHFEGKSWRNRREPFSVSFEFAMIDKKVWESVSWKDEYSVFEELSYPFCMAARKKFRIRFQKNLRCWHLQFEEAKEDGTAKFRAFG